MSDARPASARRPTVWLFDLDNTLHDASTAVYGELNRSMTGYIERELGVDRPAADALRREYWKRYGATLLGLMHHHAVHPAHFLHDTHRLPGLEDRLRTHAHDRSALAALRGSKFILTNAPREYALRVLDTLRLTQHFDGVIAIEDLRMFGHWRPKPDARILRRVVVRLKVRPQRCVLVEDTLVHQRAAHSVGMRTAWMQRWIHGAADAPGAAALVRRPIYVDRKLRSLRGLLRPGLAG